MGQRSRPGKLAIIDRIHECVFERECEIEPLRIDICPYTEMDMETQLSKVCGADIHKRFLVATIFSRDGTKVTDRFGMALDDLLKFKDWVIENQCEQVAIESTGVYWVPLYSVLEDCIPVIVANPYKIKHIPGRKTDLRDAEWIAELCLNGLI